MREHDLVAPVVRFLEAQGYRVWPDPDGSDYFDIVCRRGNEVGLVELKLADYRKLLAQAHRRRGYADWVSVVLPRASLIDKLLALPSTDRGRRVGVWRVEGDTVQVVRPHAPLRAPEESEPFPEARSRLVELLNALEAGQLPVGVRWEGIAQVPGSGRRRRATRDWRLDEFDNAPAAPPAR
ncbi:MAG: hypothetical protein L3K19_07305 [Thermoplasmata archaeon]|nr:hypothetical protein [Thermoplasmata archaeon]